MKFTFHMFGRMEADKRKICVAGHPLALVLMLIVLAWLALFVHSVAMYTWDHYSSYEGTVIEITRPWLDRVISESSDTEHLIIRTPRGRLIDKCVSSQTRLTGGIRKGDYVVKQRGFTHRVRRRDHGS